MADEKRGIFKKRPSLGRRVSFADVNSVRVFQGGFDSASENSSPNAAVNSPSVRFSAGATVSSRCNLAYGQVSPLKSSRAFCAEVGAQSSADLGGAEASDDLASSENDENCNAAFDSVVNEMELTSCVGGIIEQANNELNSTNNAQSDAEENEDDGGMELTECIGGILREISPMPHNDEVQMEMTTCVGGIIENLAALKAEYPASIDDCVMDALEDAMEMTTCVGGFIAEANAQKEVETTSMQLEKPVEPATVDVERVISKIFEEAISEASFVVEEAPQIGADANEMDFTVVVGGLLDDRNTLDLPSFLFGNDPDDADIVEATFSPTFQSSLASKSPYKRSAVAEIPLKYTDTIVENAVEVNPLIVENEAVDKIPKLNTTPNTKSEAEQRRFYEDLRGMFEASSSNSLSLFSPSDSDTTPRASLRDFLETIDVRFLDNIKSKARRETIAKQRDSEIITVPRQVFLRDAVCPEAAAYESACDALNHVISGRRKAVSRLETLFNCHPPALITDAVNSVEKFGAHFKNLKVVVRSLAKEDWRLFKRAVLVDLWERIAHKQMVSSAAAENMRNISQTLNDWEGQLSEMRVSKMHTLDLLRRTDELFSGGRFEQITAIAENVCLLQKTLEEKQHMLQEREATRQQLNQAILDENTTAASLYLSIQQSKQLLDEHRLIEETELLAKKRAVDLMANIYGFCVVRATSSSISIDFGARFELEFDVSDGVIACIRPSNSRHHVKLLAAILNAKVLKAAENLQPTFQQQFRRCALLAMRFMRTYHKHILPLTSRYVLQVDDARLCFCVRRRAAESVVLYFSDCLTKIANLNKIAAV